MFGYQACSNPPTLYSLYTVMCQYARLKNMDYLIILEIILVSGITPTISEKDREGKRALIWGRKLIKAGTLVRGNSA